MLSFRLTGTVTRLGPTGGDEMTITVASEHPSPNTANDIRWVSCVCRDPLLRARVEERLKAGDIVRIEGEIEPSRRQIAGGVLHDLVLVARWIEALGCNISEVER
jgi:hypothetical protein